MPVTSSESADSIPASTNEAPAMPRAVSVLLACAAGVVAVAGMRELAWLLGPMLLGLMLVIAVWPIQSWLIRRGVPGWLATAAAMFAPYIIILGLAATVTNSVIQLTQLLPTYSAQFDKLVNQSLDLLAKYGVGSAQINSAMHSLDTGRIAAVLSTVVSSLSNTTSMIILLLTSMFFMGLDAVGYPQRMRVLAQERPVMARALNSFTAGTRRYLVVTSFFGAIVAVLSGFALQVMGVPLPWMWAVLSFITNYIPNVGFVIALIPPMLLALLDQGVQSMIIVVIVFSVINFVVQSIIQPKIMGDDLGLAVTVTFVAIMFWSWALGAAGALLAIPLTLLIKALLIDADPRSLWVNILIGDVPGSTTAGPLADQAVAPDLDGGGPGNA